MKKQFTARLALFVLFSATIVMFQNCSNKGFESSGSLNVSQSGTLASSQESVQPSQSVSESSAAPADIASGLVVQDSSWGYNGVVYRVKQTIRGGKAGLRGCTSTMARYSVDCLSDSQFILITSAQAWGANAYNSSTDTYSVDMDVKANGWPMTTYFTRYIAADGSRKEVTFTPAVNSAAASALKLQWVFTEYTACAGPSPAPAPIGESCSREGETKTNACGTATCLYK